MFVDQGIVFALLIYLNSAFILGSSLNFHFAARSIKNTRLKKFIQASAVVLFAYFISRMVGTIVDFYVIETNPLWITLSVTVVFWSFMFGLSSYLAIGLRAQRQHQTSKKLLLLTLDDLLDDMERGQERLKNF